MHSKVSINIIDGSYNNLLKRDKSVNHKFKANYIHNSQYSIKLSFYHKPVMYNKSISIN